MNRLTTPLEMGGPESFWKAVKYFHNEPSVGMVAVRHLLDKEQVATIRAASREPNVVAPQLHLPNINSTRAKLEESFVNNGILVSTLDVMNRAHFEPEAPFELELEDFVFTGFGRGIGPHTDVLRRGLRPIGVSLSLSIGKCTFSAGLPPIELRTKSASTDSEYADWLVRAVRDTDVLHSANLEAGDAALYLQPGVHAAATSDPDRFGCLYTTQAQR